MTDVNKCQRKLIIYLKNIQKPIVLTENDDNEVNDVLSKMVDMFKQKTVTIVNTTTDYVILDPTEVSAIMLSGYTAQDSTLLNKISKNIEPQKIEAYEQFLTIVENE